VTEIIWALLAAASQRHRQSAEPLRNRRTFIVDPSIISAAAGGLIKPGVTGGSSVPVEGWHPT